MHPRTIHSSLPPPRAPQLGAQRSWKGSSQDQRWGEGRQMDSMEAGSAGERGPGEDKHHIISPQTWGEDLTYMLLVGGERCTPRTQGLGRVVVARRGLSPDFLLQKHNNHPPLKKKHTPLNTQQQEEEAAGGEKRGEEGCARSGGPSWRGEGGRVGNGWRAENPQNILPRRPYLPPEAAADPARSLCPPVRAPRQPQAPPKARPEAPRGSLGAVARAQLGLGPAVRPVSPRPWPPPLRHQGEKPSRGGRRGGGQGPSRPSGQPSASPGSAIGGPGCQVPPGAAPRLDARPGVAGRGLP